LADGFSNTNEVTAIRTGMDVVVLAGGFGTRLRPWTSHRPKPLLPILDQTMIEHVVSILPTASLSRVLIAAGYGIEQMRVHFDSLDTDYEVIIVEESEPLGTGGAIANCREHLNGETFCVINGDLLTSLRVDEMMALHEAKGGIATISLFAVDDPTRFGVADYDEESCRIRRFQEKPTLEEAFSNLINAGTYILEPEIFDRMPDGAFSMERVVFPVLAEQGLLHGFPFEGWFVDAGTPASYIEAVHNCIDNSRYIRGRREAGNWYGGSEVVDEGAIVNGCSIENGVRIEGGAIVRDSALLDSASISEAAKVTNCLIGRGAIIGSMSELDGVVVDFHSIVPAGHVQSGGRYPPEEEEEEEEEEEKEEE
jgi:mannose-1-phosphate guanylyltransferase